MQHTIYIRGIDNWPDINIRNEPGVAGSSVLFRVPKNTRATCSEARPDPAGDNYEGQTYQWFFLTFPDSRRGWARDDLLDLEGDCSAFGYGFYGLRTFAFFASGQLSKTGDQAPPAAPEFTETVVCTASVRPDIQSNVRAEPSIEAAPVGRLDPQTSVNVLSVVPGSTDPSFRWVKIRTGTISGFIREDLLTYGDGCAALGLKSAVTAPPPPPSTTASPEYRFTTPIKGNYSITNEFHQPGGHRGTDMAGRLGLGVYASGNGQVAFTVACTRCRPGAPNFASQGLALWDTAAIADPAWGYGFGNHVVVRYAWVDLPQSARDKLRDLNLENAFAYVIYAHLRSMDVKANDAVSKNTKLGELGNTGNSSGPHLHLEVRVSLSGNESNIFNRRLIDPRDMFTL